jgi:hypothetical protein
MFISRPIAGAIYVAEQRHHKFRWFRYPQGGRVDAAMVPRPIRIRAYRMFEHDRRRRDKP